MKRYKIARKEAIYFSYLFSHFSMLFKIRKYVLLHEVFCSMDRRLGETGASGVGLSLSLIVPLL